MGRTARVGWVSLTVAVLALGAVARGDLVPGGGKAASDCYLEFDVFGASGSPKVTCIDGDPACDTDGQCQGVCTFAVGICVNQTNVAGCTPAVPKKALKVKGATLVTVTTTDAAPLCGALRDVPVALGGKKRTKRGKKRITATAVVDGKPARETDRLVLLCTPREGACPTTTTTVPTTTTTTTTLPPSPDAQLLLTGARLAAVSTVIPTLVETPVEITGMAADDILVSIDRRPRNGFLYALGFDPAAGTVQLYVVHPTSAFAVLVGPPGQFVNAGGMPVDIGNGIGTRFGMDIDPAVDRVRVVASTGENFRINPNTGALVDGNLGGGVVTGLNMDGPINGTTDSVQETAYTNVDTLASFATQYTMDASLDALCIQNLPNSGTQTVCQPLGTAIDAVLGFDIAPGVDVEANNVAASGTGVAVVRPAGQLTEGLVSVDLTTGALGAVAPIGTTDIRGIAIRPPASLPIVGLTDSGTSFVRFTRDHPGTVVSVGLTGVTAGETMVGIDYRPQTGQLFGLGINATANTGTLYVLDSQTGAAIAVGTPGQIAFVGAGAIPIDFPDPAVIGWGVDFNPAVDRLRVVTGSGLDFRVNPNDGSPVDGNLGGVTLVGGTNPDGDIHGLTTSADGAAYTNNVGRPLVGGIPTTLYTLDAVTNALHIQNPPNTGTQTNELPVTLGGSPLDFTSQSGFDIPSDVSVDTSNVAATGAGYAALAVGGTTHLYAIDLATGAASDLGAIDDGTTSLTGLTVGTTALQ
ncbi:MAG TPA: DUF4394 domain-containing protein [Candidatus Binatia bacterium]|jgi:hypothetical protein|nr:DUF4394 domain-containing protein [Candidatus Binatia bacterium]